MTFGVSFGITGSVVTFRTALTTSCVPVRLQPNVMPPSLMFGQEMFSSMRGDALGIGEDPRELDVLVDRGAADVDEHDRAPIAQLGQLLADEAVDADALQADGVEHARRRLDDPRRRMPFALGEEQALDRDAAERREIDDVAVLDAVAEAAAGGDQRVGEASASRSRPKDPCQCASASQTMRRASNTGPSRHERTKCGAPPASASRTTQL